MISSIQSNNLSKIYQNTNEQTVGGGRTTPKEVAQVTQKSRIDEIKESINNGTYSIDLSASAEKMADAIL